MAFLAAGMLAAIYLFQRYDIAGLLGLGASPNGKFVINKTIRFLLNETACLLLILSIFNQAKYLRIGMMLFLTELVLLLPLYFILKLFYEGNSEISSPLLSQLHRMIVNPLLMFILIVGLLYQKYFIQRSQES